MRQYTTDAPLEEVGPATVAVIEKDTGKKVYSHAILERKPAETQLEVIFAFEDRSMARAIIKIETKDGKLGLRIQAKFL